MKNIIGRYWLAIILVLLGAIIAGIGVGTATIWRPAAQVKLSTPAQDSSPLVVSRPGMFKLYDSPAQIQIQGSGKVALAIGRSTDVAGWTVDQPYTELTGQKDQTSFSTQVHQGKNQALSPLDPAGKDMWLTTKEGTGQVTLTWAPKEGDYSLLAWAEDGHPQVSVAWKQTVKTPFFWPLLIAGATILILGLVIALVLNRISAAARKEKQAALAQKQAREKEAATGQIPVVAAPSLDSVTNPPSRKELREARARGEETVEVEGVKFPTGLVPVIKVDEDGNPLPPEAATSEENSALRDEPDTPTEADTPSVDSAAPSTANEDAEHDPWKTAEATKAAEAANVAEAAEETVPTEVKAPDQLPLPADEGAVPETVTEMAASVEPAAEPGAAQSEEADQYAAADQGEVADQGEGANQGDHADQAQTEHAETDPAQTTQIVPETLSEALSPSDLNLNDPALDAEEELDLGDPAETELRWAEAQPELETGTETTAVVSEEETELNHFPSEVADQADLVDHADLGSQADLIDHTDRADQAEPTANPISSEPTPAEETATPAAPGEIELDLSTMERTEASLESAPEAIEETGPSAFTDEDTGWELPPELLESNETEVPETEADTKQS